MVVPTVSGSFGQSPIRVGSGGRGIPICSGTLSSRERTSYEYDSKSFRVELINELDANLDGTYTLASRVSFLASHNNHTGYAQTVRETTYDASGVKIKTVDYTFGHDEIAESVVEYDPATGAPSPATIHIFGHDGHGSVRVLYDLAGTAERIAQAFTFAAYGEMLAVHDAAGVAVPLTAALTSLGYSGEHFDAKAQQQYLRARWYDPANGRFNRADDFAGSTQDPQSLHKYSYVHGNPTNASDPSGLIISSTISFGMNMVQRMGDATARVLPTANLIAFRIQYWLMTNSLRIQFWLAAGTLGTFALDAALVRLLENTEAVPRQADGGVDGEWFERKLGANATHYEIIDDHRGGTRIGNQIHGGDALSFKSSDPKLNSGGPGAPTWQKAVTEIKKEAVTVANRMKSTSNGFKPSDEAPTGLPFIKPSRGVVFYFAPQERVTWLQDPAFRRALREIQSVNRVVIRFIPVRGFQSRR